MNRQTLGWALGAITVLGWIGAALQAADGVPLAPVASPCPGPACPGGSAGVDPELAPYVNSGCGSTDPYCPDRIVDVRPPHFPWYVRAEAVMFTRDAERDFEFSYAGTPAGTVPTTSGIDYPFNAGPKLLVGRTLNECYQIEASYLDIAQWDETALERAPLALGEFASIRSTSYLQGMELNLRRYVQMPPGRAAVSFLLGVRYLRIDENFDYSSTFAVAPPIGPFADLSMETDNDLVGPQVGMLFEFFKEQCWWINFEMKGAILHNSMQRTIGSDTLAIPGGIPARATQNDTVFLGDIALMAVYRFSPRFSGRFGYQAMWIDGLALATDNFANTIELGPDLVDNEGEVVYHGPVVGLELAW